MTFRTGLLLLGFLASITTSVSASAQTPDGNEANQNDITAAESQARGVVSLVVRREPGVGSVADRVGAVITATWQNTEVIEVPASQAEAVEALLQLIPGIESVERDAVVSTPDPEAAEAPDSSGPVTGQSSTTSASTGPNDPRTRDQLWWRSVTDYAGASSVETAWARAETNERLRVVVVDGGFANHEDFSWRNGISLVDDGRGVFSYDADSCDTYHGQSVASIIGARTDNGTGMAGMLEADIHPARVLACDSSGHLYNVARAIRWAAGEDVGAGRTLPEPADIVNLSLSAETTCTSNLQAAIDTANQAGALVVASAGNSRSDASGYAPASCRGVVTVGAVTRDGDQTSFSNYGSALTVSALGQQVRVQGPEDGHRWMSGTSFSAPIVSGILGLIAQDIPELERDTLLDLLSDAVTPLTSSSNPMGAGILNAARLQEEVAGLLGRDEPSLHHAMSVRTDGDGDSPFWSHVDEKRLCSLYEFDANERAETGVDYYSIFRVPQGEALTMDNAEHVQSGESVRFVLSNPETAGYDFGLQFCSNENGEDCRSSELIPLQTARLQAPARCR
mgnify:FL=1